MPKPIHVKPNFYATCLDALKEISMTYGYNLVTHGSMTRDLDLLIVPWNREVKPHLPMIKEFAEYLGGWIDTRYSNPSYHGRLYVINMNVKPYTNKMGVTIYPQYYLDISVIQSVNSKEIDNSYSDT